MKWVFLFILSFFSILSFSDTGKIEKAKAIANLKKVLSKYQTQSLHFKVKKKLNLPSIGEIIKEEGQFFIEKQKFYLSLEGQPSYLMIFDGTHLWYQSDKSEKIVFKLKKHPQLDIFFGLFDPKQFFIFFSIKSFKREGQKYSFQMNPTDKLQGIKEISIVVGDYLEEAKIIWSDLGEWQQYSFYNPWHKSKFPKSRFQFKVKNFEVISKENL